VAKADYGIDAPGVVRNLALCGAALLIIRAFTATIRIGPVNVVKFEWTGIALLATAGMMLLYSKIGKMRHRDRMINMAALKGNERVLDVGTGRGLLLIAAAKKLSQDKGGHAIGIDIWKASDLSENLRDRTQQNLEIEDVADRCELIDAPAEKMQFADGSFDVVVSNMCLHNIPKPDGRRQACLEIVRVLRRGGVAVISDYKNTKTYARIFKDAGLMVSRRFYFADTFFPVSIVLAKKPA
jgi:ubiquinone/menaquinone biosynthesis C-methylase UbiE